MNYSLIPSILAFVSTCNAAVIQNDAMIVTPTTAPAYIDRTYLPFSLQFILTQSAPPGNGLFLLEVVNASSTTFTFNSFGIAEAYSLFLTSPGTVFGVDYVNTSPSFVSNWNSPTSATLTLGIGQSAYIGYWDNRTINGYTTAYPTDLFGWARVRNQSGTLTVVESATATGEGIIVGTLQQIPEPASGIMVILSASALLFRRQKISLMTAGQT